MVRNGQKVYSTRYTDKQHENPTPGAGFVKPLHLTKVYFPTAAGNKMHSLVRKSSLVRLQGL